jgi:hypothetical protein
VKLFKAALVESFYVVAFLWLTSCATVDPAPAPSPWPPAGGYSCATYCQRAEVLGCAFAAPTVKGTTCEQVCIDVTQVLRWDFVCRSNATTCFEIDGCERK